MIIYLAAFEAELYYKFGVKHNVKSFLYSFHTLKSGKTLVKRHNPKCDVFIDSGGYSARQQGVKINVVKYARFLNKYKDYYDVAANLDVSSVEETLRNQAYLIKKTKAKIIPVYHVSDFENEKHKGLLDDFIKEFDYIGVGGLAGNNPTPNAQERFLNYVFSKTRDKIKVHGFGIMAKKWITRYPFYSVDSTNWLVGSQYGAITGKDGKFHSKNRRAYLEHHRSVKDLVDYKERTDNDLKYWSKLEKEITRLWEKKGIIWK